MRNFPCAAPRFAEAQYRCCQAGSSQSDGMAGLCEVRFGSQRQRKESYESKSNRHGVAGRVIAAAQSNPDENAIHRILDDERPALDSMISLRVRRSRRECFRSLLDPNGLRFFLGPSVIG